MKAAIAIASLGAAFFLFAGLQAGWFGPNRRVDAETLVAAEQDGEAPKPVAKKSKQPKEAPPPPAAFPADLEPGARAQAVPKAAEYKPSGDPQKMVFLKVNGALHPWHKTHEDYNDDWHTERVEETALVVVVGEPRKTFVDRTVYKGAPSVDRFRWDLEVSVVAPKTGKVLASLAFVNMPRPIGQVEDWGLVTIGTPVQYRTVFLWASGQAKAGFPVPVSPNPIVTVVGH